MKKAILIFSIIAAVYSLFYFVISILVFSGIQNPVIEYINEEHPYAINGRNAVLYLLIAILSIVNIFKTNKALSAILIIVSFFNTNIWGLIVGILSLKFTIDNEKELKRKENEEKGIVENNLNTENQDDEIIIKKEPEIIITDKYKVHFIIAIIINILYIVAYVAYLVTVVINNYDAILHLISPWHVFNDLGPAALGFIIIYPFYVVVFLFFAVLYSLPLFILIFSLMFNIGALKKQKSTYYAIRVLGILTLIFINSYRSFRIVSDIERQKREGAVKKLK